MKLNFSFSKLLDNNKFVKVFSVFIAIITWGIVTSTVDTNTDTVINNVPIDFDIQATTPEAYGLSVIESSKDTIDIRVEGKRYKIGTLKETDFIVEPILTSVTKSGEYEVKLDVRKANTSDTDYNIVSYSSDTVKITFDTVKEKTFILSGLAENVQAAEGYVKEEIITSPETITLSGPQYEIDKIVKCVIESKKKEEAATETLVLEGNLIFYDKDNNVLNLEHIIYYNTKFEITIPIYKNKVVPVLVNFINVPSNVDVDRLSYTLSEDTIQILGPTTLIDSIESIDIGEIDFRKISVGSSFDLEVKLPSNIINVDGIETIKFTVNSDSLSKKSLSIKNIICKNIPSQYNISVQTKSINNVTVVGDITDIKNISSDDLIAIVDLQNIQIADGTSRVTVSVYATGNKFVWAVGEYSVIINASKKQ